MSKDSITPPPAVPFGSTNSALKLAIDSLHHLSAFCGQAASACVCSADYGNTEEQVLSRLTQVGEATALLLSSLQVCMSHFVMVCVNSSVASILVCCI